MEEKSQKSKVKSQKLRKKVQAISSMGKIYITATFNNTLITITSDSGDTISWSSSGARGFKGTRRSTPYAASLAVEDAAKRAIGRGLKTVEVYIKGPGAGRDSSLRAIKSAGLSIAQIADITPIPHNGPRAKKRRRV
ncbi:MAG: 30S ribosomal protein S11 [Candidatus Levybacteria bacterium RIFCSPHIGHO2_12_FULL_38_12]|nr:MAG: 30S ribosomal protein S11 [Candidatus Levybacteria bacterium RIFCSPHIGHO2_01_FULL_38_12]OGH21949.1 MAG: 30S ribosomal protein S11 [Candidatus Levybacteria bacterium RIFCSPHIGHO2_02_FULL_37_18]OGH23021.1 MAG: 30S ribosomal protein S11 [Candidatus Levybacteria bacterium RIFCSPHIGHO2_12_FULL_38_12]OGH33643.1 MAG: 30S ribosomal protein S11 [Candidatus Levybacteria bacterium RIFCSPLOWO2_01_FULL_37_20]OGH44548.1 MAG: 30S ribosomal protein S11 [Candidatus Levybacteria bacterium RIFCSPLOWO2_02_